MSGLQKLVIPSSQSPVTTPRSFSMGQQVDGTQRAPPSVSISLGMGMMGTGMGSSSMHPREEKLDVIAQLQKCEEAIVELMEWAGHSLLALAQLLEGDPKANRESVVNATKQFLSNLKEIQEKLKAIIKSSSIVYLPFERSPAGHRMDLCINQKMIDVVYEQLCDLDATCDDIMQQSV